MKLPIKTLKISLELRTEDVVWSLRVVYVSKFHKIYTLGALKMEDVKMTDQVERHENTGLENAVVKAHYV